MLLIRCQCSSECHFALLLRALFDLVKNLACVYSYRRCTERLDGNSEIEGVCCEQKGEGARVYDEGWLLLCACVNRVLAATPLEPVTSYIN